MTRISLPMLSSTAVPHIMSASSPTSLYIRSEASVISSIVKSLLLVMFIKTPLAPEMEISSNNGWDMARWAASTARFSPLAMPMPMMARPALDIIVLTSAKSRLISPGIIIRSVIPLTEWSSTSSAFLNISIILAFLDARPLSLSLGMVITVSATFLRNSIPSSACLALFRPSNENGFVTTATVKTSISLQSSAMTGAAPVPVPPPNPAVMNTI